MKDSEKPSPSGASLVGPALAGAAAVFAVVLIGGVAYVGYHQKLSGREPGEATATAAVPEHPGSEPGTLRSGPCLPGLRAYYFGRGTCEGPAVERIEPAIDFSPPTDGDRSPVTAGAEEVAVRWEGQFLAERSGNFGFILSVSGRARLVLDGRDLVSWPQGTSHALRHSLLRKKLSEGWHEILLEYSGRPRDGRCVLRYVPPGELAPDIDLEGAEPAGCAIPPRLLAHLGK